MTSILFVIERICRNQYKCSYLTIKKILSQFLAPFVKTKPTFEHFETRDETHSFMHFANHRLQITSLENLKKPCFRTPFGSLRAKS